MLIDMKAVAASERQTSNKKTPRISVNGEQPKVCTKENSMKVTLRSNPKEASSATFEETVPYLEGNEIETQDCL